MLPRLLYSFSKGVPFAVSRRYVGATALSKSPLVRQFPSSAEIGIRHHSSNNQNKEATIKVDNPQLMIAFTCKACNTRSSHTFSKQAYNKGTVAIQCPGCKNRHLIADNLGIFRDKKYNLEDILKAKGESVATSTEDLVFEDIPKDLRDSIGHYAKDAPEEYKKRLSEDEIRSLQNPDNNNKK